MRRAFLLCGLALGLAACAAGPTVVVDEEAPTVMLPADGSRLAMRPEPPLVLPAALPGADRATEGAIARVVRDYCLPALEQPSREASLAAEIGAVSTPNPWHGRPFLDAAPAKAWAITGAPRSFFWVERDESGETNTCWVKAFDGRRAVMAPIALRVVEDYAAAQGFGPTRYPGRALAELEQRGTIERIYGPRLFGASLSWDRSDYPRLEGFVVTVSAAPAAPQSAN